MKQFFNRSCGILGFCCKETALSVGGSSARCAGAADFCGKPLGFSRSLILLPVVLPLSPSFGRTTATHLRMLVDELQTPNMLRKDRDMSDCRPTRFMGKHHSVLAEIQATREAADVRWSTKADELEARRQLSLFYWRASDRNSRAFAASKAIAS